MRTIQQMSVLPAPQNGVVAFVEGVTVRIFFDFGPAPDMDGEPAPSDLRACESIDVDSRAHGDIVAAIIGGRYSADAAQAVIANYDLARDPDSGITEAKREEYLQEYAAWQAWRARAKEVAREVASILE